MAPLGGTGVHVGHTVLTGTVGEGAALAVVGREGDAVVVYTEVLLVVGLCRPPLGAGCSGRAAAHVGRLFVGDAPLLAGDAAEVGRVVYLRLIEGELLGGLSLTEAVAVAEFQGYGIGTGLWVVVANLRQCGVLRAVEDPDGIGTGRRIEMGNHLIGLLVDGDVEVTGSRRDTVGVSAVEALGRAGGEGCSDTTAY